MPQPPRDDFDEESYNSDGHMPGAYEESYGTLSDESGDMDARQLVRGGTGGDGGIDPYVSGQEPGPVLIPGTGTSMGTPFIKRRPRPLTMRLTIILVLACLLATGLISATPSARLKGAAP
jgi:hypothetical protein